jgi:hypothetical protein
MAQITITMPDVQVPRVLAALNAANAAEAKSVIIDFLKGSVVAFENQQLRDAQEAQINQDLNDTPIT